jgi:hypothetical protein
MLLVVGEATSGLAAFTRNPLMPCFSSVLPVAMLVQIVGETNGRMEWRMPDAPSLLMRARFGMRPSSARRLTRDQSRPSIPTITILEGAAVTRAPSDGAGLRT